MVLTIGLDGGELVAVLGQQLLQDGCMRACDLGGVVLALHGEADLLLLEAVEHVGLRRPS